MNHLNVQFAGQNNSAKSKQIKELIRKQNNEDSKNIQIDNTKKTQGVKLYKTHFFNNQNQHLNIVEIGNSEEIIYLIPQVDRTLQLVEDEALESILFLCFSFENVDEMFCAMHKCLSRLMNVCSKINFRKKQILLTKYDLTSRMSHMERSAAYGLIQNIAQKQGVGIISLSLEYNSIKRELQDIIADQEKEEAHYKEVMKPIYISYKYIMSNPTDADVSHLEKYARKEVTKAFTEDQKDPKIDQLQSMTTGKE